MKLAIGCSLVLSTCIAIGCSGSGSTTQTGHADESGSTGTGRQALYTYSDSGTTYDCTTLNKDAFGTSGDAGGGNYDPSNGNSPHGLYGFLLATKTHADADNNHHSDGSTTSETTDVNDALSNLNAATTWLNNNGYDASNAGAAYNIEVWMNAIIVDLQDAAHFAAVSSVTNYSGGSSNDASYVVLYARKAIELANQAASNADYCYLKYSSHQIENAASFVNISCANVP